MNLSLLKVLLQVLQPSHCICNLSCFSLLKTLFYIMQDTYKREEIGGDLSLLLRGLFVVQGLWLQFCWNYFFVGFGVLHLSWFVDIPDVTSYHGTPFCLIFRNNWGLFMFKTKILRIGFSQNLHDRCVYMLQKVLYCTKISYLDVSFIRTLLH